MEVIRQTMFGTLALSAKERGRYFMKSEEAKKLTPYEIEVIKLLTEILNELRREY